MNSNWRQIFTTYKDTFEVLYAGDYLKVISPKEHPYEAVLDTDGVLIFPILNNKIGIRLELCPPYLVKDASGEKKYYTVISGGMDEGEEPKETLIRELKEESGIVLKKGKLTTLAKDSAYVKNTASRISIFIIVIEEYDEVEIKGDGTEYEKESKTLWVTIEELKEIIQKPNIDFLLLSMYYILKNFLR